MPTPSRFGTFPLAALEDVDPWSEGDFQFLLRGYVSIYGEPNFTSFDDDAARTAYERYRLSLIDVSIRGCPGDRSAAQWMYDILPQYGRRTQRLDYHPDMADRSMRFPIKGDGFESAECYLRRHELLEKRERWQLDMWEHARQERENKKRTDG